MPLMLLAGVIGGMIWAAIPAFLRTRFNTNEILVTLMLVYIAQLMLSWLVHGPWRDPQGQNYPQSQGFGDAETMSVLIEGTRVTWGIIYALGLALIAWVFSQKTFAGFRMQVAGLAPAAAAYAGFSEKRNIWIALMLCGATAGLAGICEVAGPIGRLQQEISPGYGFAAIIVAWIGRLHPIGVVFGALADVAAVSRRRVGADGDGHAVRDHRFVPGVVAVLSAGRRPVHLFPTSTRDTGG